jgi:formamidopyrimidine-DNA glycosylase
MYFRLRARGPLAGCAEHAAVSVQHAERRHKLDPRQRRGADAPLDEGGTSFDAQYVNVNGASGYFSHSLRAYGQQGKPCPRCERPIVREQFMKAAF